jgi:hypothetical protein
MRNKRAVLAFDYQHNLEAFMKTLALVFSTVFCLAAFPAFAGATANSKNSISLAQADVTIGPNGIGIAERGRDRDRGGCKTVTVEERGETRTTRRCD